MNRRKFIQASAIAAASAQTVGRALAAPAHKQFAVPVQRLTNGPAYHWFGYYDKLQFDPASRFVLGMEVDFEGHSPAGTDSIKIGMIDLQNGNRWIELGRSAAWGWQQGCMLQWVPGSSEEIIWNDRQGDRYVSRLMNIRTRIMRTLSKAIYALSPDGKWAIGTEFSRIQNLRPGYGYAGVPDPYEQVKAPIETGLYKINLTTGEVSLLFSYAELAKIPYNGMDVSDNWHWFNHLLISNDGSRFTFLHRWREKIEDRQKMAGSGFITRMFTADMNGKDLYCIDPSGFTSHFVWRDPQHICAYTKPAGRPSGFYVLEDKTGKAEQIGAVKMPVNGHQTYLPGHWNEWLLNDCYPQQGRMQTPYLYHIPTDKRIDLGNFFSPESYKGEWRCDLHPRFSPDGKKVVIDSTHEGMGRQLYLLDISKAME